MATTRSYGDGCGIAQGLDIVGERWALLVVRELLLGPKRFVDLQSGLPNVGPNVLSHRLRELERAGVVKRAQLPPPAGSRIYELTDWGHELEDTVIPLGRWAARSPSSERDDPIGTDSVVLALRTLFDPSAATGLRATYELGLRKSRFRIEVADATLEIAHGVAAHPDAIIETDPETLRAILWHDRRLAEARRSGDLTIDGSRDVVERFVRLFPLPAPSGSGVAS
jgi:DNA-binding HxlR family transcriptional regulator